MCCGWANVSAMRKSASSSARLEDPHPTQICHLWRPRRCPLCSGSGRSPPTLELTVSDSFQSFGSAPAGATTGRLGRVLLTVPSTAVVAGGADPSTHARPCHGRVERLLVLGSTGHCRPATVIHAGDSESLKLPLSAARQTRCAACAAPREFARPLVPTVFRQRRPARGQAWPPRGLWRVGPRR